MDIDRVAGGSLLYGTLYFHLERSYDNIYKEKTMRSENIRIMAAFKSKF